MSSHVRAFRAGWSSVTSGSPSLTAFVSRLVHASSPASAPFLSDLRLVLLIIIAYLILLHVVRSHQTLLLRDARFVTNVAIVHNLVLAAASAFMNVHATRAILWVLHAHKWHATVCTPTQSPLPQPILATFYLFYLSKFYELLDTFILVTRGKSLSLLHVWHHSSVILSVWGWLEYGVTIGVYGLWFNTFVHVIMYTYFALRLARVKMPFKRLITLTQIVQFLTGFASLIPFTWSYVKHGGCTGLPGLAITAAINFSYLVLFLRFYSKSYESAAGKPKSSPSETRKAR
ncbi:unnamed protein product [Agarophyton chilense]